MDELLDTTGSGTAQIVDKPSKRPSGRPKGAKESREARENRQNRKILELRAKNVPVPAIATAVGLAPRTVDIRLSKMQVLLQQIDKLKDWERDKADYLSAAQHVLLKSMMQQDKLDKASVNNLAYAFQQVHTATRLERNQATANTQTVVRYTTLPDIPETEHATPPDDKA